MTETFPGLTAGLVAPLHDARRAICLALLGIALSLGAPAGLWILWRLLPVAMDPQRLHELTLLYVAVSTVIAFGSFG